MLARLQSDLNALNEQRAQVLEEGWYLQQCWLLQVKPGGTARTGSKYWQVRSRQPMFDGKTLKHLQPEEVEDYRAAIARGRLLKQIDRQIEQLQRQIAQLTSTGKATPSNAPTLQEAPLPVPMLPTDRRSQPLPLMNSTELAQQAHLVDEVLADSEALRDVLRQSTAANEVSLTKLAEQRRLVQEVLAHSQALRNTLRQSRAASSQLRAGSVSLRNRSVPPYWEM